MELERESRSDFLKIRPRSIIVELVSMMSKEDEVTLIVPSDDTPFFKFWVLREERSDHSSNS